MKNISSLFERQYKPTVLTLQANQNKFAYMRYGERLRLARGKMSQAKLADLTETSQSLISQLENSQTATGSEYTPRFARALGINVDWLADELGGMADDRGYVTRDPELVAVLQALEQRADYHAQLSPDDQQTLSMSDHLPPDKLLALINQVRTQHASKGALLAALLTRYHEDETRETQEEPKDAAHLPDDRVTIPVEERRKRQVQINFPDRRRVASQ